MIFLVDEFKENWYKKFSRVIQNDDSMVQKLEKSEGELVKIVKDQYEKIKKRMEIRTETNSEVEMDRLDRFRFFGFGKFDQENRNGLNANS